MTLPKRVEHRQPRVRRDLASALRSAAAGLPVTGGPPRQAALSGRDLDPELASLREKMRRHPVHRESDRETQVRVAERYLRIERDNAALQKKVAAATNSLARTFDRIVGLLTERASSELTDGDPAVTDDGRLLARIYSESDLLVAECLRTGAWAGLEDAELAAVLSAVLYETRGGDGPGRAAQRGGADRAVTAGADIGPGGCRRSCAPMSSVTASRRVASPTTDSSRPSTAGPAAATWSPLWPPPTPRAPVRRCRRGFRALVPAGA